MIEEQKQIYEFDEFRLDVMKRQLLREGQVVPLYSKAFDLLLVLVQRGGSLLTKDELLETVWPGQILEEANLTVTMSAVRKALGEKAAQPRFIVTIPGRGYRFVADLRGGPQDLVIESETIKQITVEEESRDDQVIERADATPLLVSDNSATADISMALRTGAHAKRPFALLELASRPAVLILTVILIALIVVASLYVMRRSQNARAAALRFTQIRATPITNNGKVGTVAMSPDGRFFVFAQAVRGPNQGTNGLYLGQLGGEKTIELVPPSPGLIRGPEYGRDGSNVFYSKQMDTEGHLSLYRISTLGGVPVKLRDNISTYFTLSPDNRRLAFVREDAASKTRSLITSNLDGSDETSLTTLPRASLSLNAASWSPDGSMIAIGARQDGSAPSLAVFLVKASTGERTPLTASLWRDITRVVWLKDGSGLLIIAAGVDTRESRQVWFVHYPGGEARHVTNDASLYDVGLSVSSDPNNFLLVQLKQLNNIWVGPADDFSKAKQVTFATFNITNGNFAFDWMPDNRIVYASTLSQDLNLWTMDADGRNVKEITPSGHADAAPSTSAAGRFVVFASNRTGTEEIWRVDPDGANPKQLTTCGQNRSPSTSPDGKWIVYVSGCDGTNALWRISIDGGEGMRLTEKAVAWPWVSPDNKWIACGYESSPDKWQLAIIPFDGGQPVKLFDVPPLANFNFAIRWMPDGKSITYRDWAWGIWRQPVEGGPAQRIPGLPDDKFYSYGWSRDGKLFAYSRGAEIRDVVLISNSN